MKISKYIINAIQNLGENENSYKEFGKSILNLFSHVGMPENKKELLNVLAAIPKFSDKFLVVKSNVPVKVSNTDNKTKKE